MGYISEKICCHCSVKTFAQPQNFDLNLGFGFCSGCLETLYTKEEAIHGTDTSIYIYRHKTQPLHLAFIAKYCTIELSELFTDTTYELLKDHYTTKYGQIF